MTWFIQQFLGLVRLVQMRHQFGLKIVFDEVHQKMHNCLRHWILNRFPDDVKVRFDETFYRWMGKMLNCEIVIDLWNVYQLRRSPFALCQSVFGRCCGVEHPEEDSLVSLDSWHCCGLVCCLSSFLHFLRFEQAVKYLLANSRWLFVHHECGSVCKTKQKIGSVSSFVRKRENPYLHIVSFVNVIVVNVWRCVALWVLILLLLWLSSGLLNVSVIVMLIVVMVPLIL